MSSQLRRRRQRLEAVRTQRRGLRPTGAGHDSAFCRRTWAHTSPLCGPPARPAPRRARRHPQAWQPADRRAGHRQLGAHPLAPGVADTCSQRRVGGVWTGLPLGSPTARQTRVWLKTGVDYHFRVRGIDDRGRSGPWYLQRRRDRRPAWAGRHPAWRRRRAGGDGGWQRPTSTTWARARFTGSSVALVASTGPGMGQVRVFVNGKRRAIVDLHREFGSQRELVWTKHFYRVSHVRWRSAAVRSREARRLPGLLRPSLKSKTMGAAPGYRAPVAPSAGMTRSTSPQGGSPPRQPWTPDQAPQGVTCPACALVNEAGARVCRNCGLPIASTADPLRGVKAGHVDLPTAQRSGLSGMVGLAMVIGLLLVGGTLAVSGGGILNSGGRLGVDPVASTSPGVASSSAPRDDGAGPDTPPDAVIRLGRTPAARRPPGGDLVRLHLRERCHHRPRRLQVAPEPVHGGRPRGRGWRLRADHLGDVQARRPCQDRHHGDHGVDDTEGRSS